jgi:competence protein ComEC
MQLLPIKRPLFFVLVCIIVIDLMLLLTLLSIRPKVLTIAFLDVGQGDAVFIEAPNGNQLLYDAGPPSGATVRELAKVMPFWDRSLDVMVLSHPDLDHIGGAVDVLKRYTVPVVLESGSTGASGAVAELASQLNRLQTDRLLARRGQTIELGGGVFVDVLYPDSDSLPEETNDASVTIKVRYGATSFLLSGDLSRWGEYRILDEHQERLTATVVKLGHHGSQTSSSERWLTELEPDIVVVSAGKNNKYGHPHQEVMDLLDRLHIKSVRTDLEGSIVFTSDGKSVVRE